MKCTCHVTHRIQELIFKHVNDLRKRAPPIICLYLQNEVTGIGRSNPLGQTAVIVIQYNNIAYEDSFFEEYTSCGCFLNALLLKKKRLRKWASIAELHL